MLPIGLNHMTVPRKSARELLGLAAQLGCVGVELRNDLPVALFDGDTPEAFAKRATEAGLDILGLAELKAFNTDTAAKAQSAAALIDTAARCGAKGVALIPAVGNTPLTREQQRQALRTALEVLQPVLENSNMRGLIEPLGFATSSLRYKSDVAAVLAQMGGPACFAIVHDTFHHHLAGEDAIFADLTAIVHISGVDNLQPKTDQMTDADRVLVGPGDRLGTVAQLDALIRAGYKRPASFEAFAPDIHDMTDPADALAGSIAFIASQIPAAAAFEMG